MLASLNFIRLRILTTLTPIRENIVVFLVPLLRSSFYIFSLTGRFFRRLAPIAYLLTAVGVLIASFTFILELDGRFIQRKFQAWTIIQNYGSIMRERNRNPSGKYHTNIALSGDLRDALEFLNREFDGLICDAATDSDAATNSNAPSGLTVQNMFATLTGISNRSCVIPKRQRAELSGLIATSAHLPYIDLEGSKILEGQFTGSNLSLANFRNSDLSLSDLSNTIMFATDFEGGQFVGSKFENSCLLLSNFRNATLTDADFTGAYLIGANFTGAQLEGAIFDGAHLVDEKMVFLLTRLWSRDEGQIADNGALLQKIQNIFGNLRDEIKEKITLTFGHLSRICQALVSPKARRSMTWHFGSPIEDVFEDYVIQHIEAVFKDYVTKHSIVELGRVSFAEGKNLVSDQFVKVACPELSEMNSRDSSNYLPKLPDEVTWHREHCNGE